MTSGRPDRVVRGGEPEDMDVLDDRRGSETVIVVPSCILLGCSFSSIDDVSDTFSMIALVALPVAWRRTLMRGWARSSEISAWNQSKSTVVKAGLVCVPVQT
jgi:hypothetical protein